MHFFKRKALFKHTISQSFKDFLESGFALHSRYARVRDALRNFPFRPVSQFLRTPWIGFTVVTYCDLAGGRKR